MKNNEERLTNEVEMLQSTLERIKYLEQYYLASVLHSISNANEALVSVGLPELYDLIQSNFEGQFIGDAKVTERGKDAINGEVIKTGIGVLRLKFGDFNSRILILSNKMIRVFSYPVQGEVTDMYLVSPSIFTSIDRELTIKFKG